MTPQGICQAQVLKNSEKAQAKKTWSVCWGYNKPGDPSPWQKSIKYSILWPVYYLQLFPLLFVVYDIYTMENDPSWLKRRDLVTIFDCHDWTKKGIPSWEGKHTVDGWNPAPVDR